MIDHKNPSGKGEPYLKAIYRTADDLHVISCS